MADPKFWPEDTDPHCRWSEYREARHAECGTPTDRVEQPGGGQNAEITSGGYQRPDVEGHRAYDPGERGAQGTGAERGLPEGAAEEITAPFDEDSILDHVDRTGSSQRRRERRPVRHPADERLHAEISERLKNDRWLDAAHAAAEITVRVQNGEVTLSGTVDSRSTRRRAEDLAGQVPGVAYVQNDLRARNPHWHAADRAAPPETNAREGIRGGALDRKG